MELIERYIHEVGRRLPRKMRADVETELRSLLLDSLEERMEEGITEPGEISEELQVEVLKEFGRPRKVAQQYNPRIHYIIGPRLYEPYLITLAVVLSTILVVNLMGVLSLLLQPIRLTQGALGDAVAGLITSLQAGLGSITLTFALIERAIAGKAEQEEEATWDPRTMPKIADRDRIKVSGLVIETAFLLFLIAMLNFYPDRIGLSFVRIDGEFKMTSWLVPGFTKVYGPLLSAWWFLTIVLNVAVLWQGQWQRMTHLVKAGLSFFGAYIFYQIATGPEFVVTAQGGFIGDVAGVPDILNTMVNQGMKSGLMVIAAVLAFSGLKIVYRLLNVRPITITQKGASD